MFKLKKIIPALMLAGAMIGLNACDGLSGEKTYGGTLVQNGYDVRKTSDNGAIVAGEAARNNAGMDFYVLKLDVAGNEEWRRILGGTGNDVAKVVRQTTDGGYIVAGTTESYGPGDPEYYGSYGNVWVVKFDANGNQQWNKTYGYDKYDSAESLELTADGGYIVAGASVQSDATKVYVIKIDANGTEQWSKFYGVAGQNSGAKSIKPTLEGDYLIAGTTGSTAETADSLFIKIDAAGDVIWQKTYGVTGVYDYVKDMNLTADGGLIAAGMKTDYFPGGTSDSSGEAWVLKLDQDGNLEWENTYGGSLDDGAYSIQQTKEGGYVFAGETDSYGQAVRFQPDVWIVKLDMVGNMQWSKTYGGGDVDIGRSIQQIDADGGYLVAGSMMKSLPNFYDVYVLRLDADGNK